MSERFPESPSERLPESPPTAQTRKGSASKGLLIGGIVILAVALAVAVGIYFVNKPHPAAGGPLPNAADTTTLLKESSQTTKAVKSTHLVLTVTGKIKHLPVKILTGDLTTTPATAAKGDGTIAFGDQDVDVKFVVDGGDLYAALSGDNWADYGPAAKVYDLSALLNPDNGLGNLLANFTNPKSEARETIGGQNTIRITGQVSADAVNKVASQLEATQPLAATVWIQDSGAHQLVQAKLDQSPGNSIQMTLSNWNAPVQVSKPAVSG
jgi:lipoprotein LprG